MLIGCRVCQISPLFGSGVNAIMTLPSAAGMYYITVYLLDEKSTWLQKPWKIVVCSLCPFKGVKHFIAKQAGA